MPVADRTSGPTGDDARMREVEVRIARLEERQSADRDARGIATQEIDRRLETMNEVREQINSERGKYLEREVADERHALLVQSLNLQDARLTRLEANASAQKRATQVLVGGATLLISFVVLLANFIT